MATSNSKETTCTHDQQIPLLIASPSPDDANAKQVSLGSSETVKLHNLGPLVVNSDGTLSRIANWENMTEQERERTMRVLAARTGLDLQDKQLTKHNETTTLILTEGPQTTVTI